MQKQPHKNTVQDSIEEALKNLNIHSDVLHAGRTDKGVHALNQVVCFKIPQFWDKNKLLSALNKILHPYIHIKKLFVVSDNFNPRFDAKKRSYRYVITSRFTPHSADYMTYYPVKIDIKLLKKALKLFEGKHDFEYFAKTGSDVSSYTREIYKTNIYKYKHLTVIKIQGNGFLRGQIRIMINFLLKINEGELSLNDLEKQLCKKKLITKHLSPPSGLYLERIWY